MGRQFLPSSDAALLSWSNNFSTLISTGAVSYGLTTAQATAYATLNIAYASALATATEPTTRTKSAVMAKNQARANLKQSASSYGKMIEANLTVSNAQKINLGLTVKVQPSPVPVPSSVPAINVLSVNAWTVRIKLSDTASSAKRGKPPGVSGASIFSFVGAVPPNDMGSWTFQGNAGLTKLDVVFANTYAPGTKVWLTAFWFNGRKQSGQASAPVSANLPGGSVSMAA